MTSEFWAIVGVGVVLFLCAAKIIERLDRIFIQLQDANSSLDLIHTEVHPERQRERMASPLNDW